MIQLLKHLCVLSVFIWASCQQNTNDNAAKALVDTVLQHETLVASEIELKKLDEHFTFIISNDNGKNGYYDQKVIAEAMGETVNIVDAKFMAALGDVHHYLGVGSVNDPLWLTNYEWVYSHPELLIPWFPILGNHEYQGNTDAVIAYSAISSRWQMPGRYYTKTYEVTDSTSVLLVFIDTSPLITKYRVSDKHPDARKQSDVNQLKWIENVLQQSTAKWKIVMGHHPIYAGTTKDGSEREDLQNRLLPMLEKYRVDAYYCGHIHNFQHIKPGSSSIDFFVNSSASQSRKVVPFDGSVFTSAASGFALCSLNDTVLVTTLIDKNGKILYQYPRKK